MRPLWALGLMSGTSLDGIDAAMVQTDGVRIFAFGESRFRPYQQDEHALLRRALGAMPDAPGLSEVTACVDMCHSVVAEGFSPDVVGYHGQTLSHDPSAFHTFQVGDGTALSESLGRTVVWDFRTADVLSGGEGAPLVPVFHFAAAKMAELEGYVAILNIGGVANVTWLDAGAEVADSPDALLAFDTGPGNALINDFMAARRDMGMDRDGALAAEGVPDEGIVARLLTHPYFTKPPPKSLDRDAFRHALDALRPLSDADGAATLTALTAASIAASTRHMPHPPDRWLITGGGRQNATLMRMIAAHTNTPVDPVEAVGLDGDMLEAQAFGYLAVRVLRGLPTSLPGTTGARLAVCGGRVSGVEPKGTGT
ncbi:MAG: anhydro-N-acetylmuramic acid kinase [Pseudomonadota bacterium]